MVPFFVCEGDQVEIMLNRDPRQHSQGKVSQIRSGVGSDTVSVVLTNGDFGTVIRIINSPEIIKDRIMGEGQYTENKEKFGEWIMKNEVIPKTVQSFLNTDGGYLYIGIRDTGTLEDRLVGLNYDFDIIRSKEKDIISEDEICDKLGREVIDSLTKYLSADTQIGPLVSIDFPEIQSVRIMQISIKRSIHPWFFKHLTKQNKEKVFQVRFADEKPRERRIDDFYIREGSSKKKLETHQEFYKYLRAHFRGCRMIPQDDGRSA